ncbi:MAG: DUF4276 family protein [Pseudomonadota bacterium]
MEEALKALLPKIVPGRECLFVVHEGKPDLEKSIPRKLRAWQAKDDVFVVVRDQDSFDCHLLKEHLVDLCIKGGREDVLVRIACKELESWFLGDLAAMEAGLGVTNLSRLEKKRKYRDPDRLGNPKEEIRKLVKNYRQISGARAVGPHLEPRRNNSKSFQVFVSGLLRLSGLTSDMSVTGR